MERKEIGGELHEVSPEAWKAFDDWYGDKSYRHAYVVAEIEKAVRDRVTRGIAELQTELRESGEEMSSREVRDALDWAMDITDPTWTDPKEDD